MPRKYKSFTPRAKKATPFPMTEKNKANLQSQKAFFSKRIDPSREYRAKKEIIAKINSSPGMTRDNIITNKKVLQGKLPPSQLEIYPQARAIRRIFPRRVR